MLSGCGSSENERKKTTSSPINQPIQMYVSGCLARSDEKLAIERSLWGISFQFSFLLKKPLRPEPCMIVIFVTTPTKGTTFFLSSRVAVEHRGTSHELRSQLVIDTSTAAVLIITTNFFSDRRKKRRTPPSPPFNSRHVNTRRVEKDE